jgi:hypothetical protein
MYTWPIARMTNATALMAQITDDEADNDEDDDQ